MSADGREATFLVIRPGDEEAIVEDIDTGARYAIDSSALAAQILGRSVTAPDQPGTGSDWVASPAAAAWVDAGWRRSLEYLVWSEQEISTRELPTRVVADPGQSRQHGAVEMSPLGRSLGDVLLERRTHRVYDPAPVPADVLRRVLQATVAGACSDANVIHGSLTGIQLMVVAYAVDGLASGVWALDSAGGTLVPVVEGDHRVAMSEIMCGMSAALTAAATVVVCADLAERQRAYPYERALRELYIEVGQIGQWFILAAEREDLGCLITPATNDRDLASLLSLSSDTSPLYTMSLGRKRPPRGAR